MRRFPVQTWSVLSSGALLFTAGCAGVDSRPDYRQTARLVEETTGQPVLYQPAESHRVPDQVEQLLEGGLSVDDAVQVYLLNSRRLQAAMQEVGAARADLVQASLFSNPSLSVGAGFADSGGLPRLEVALAQNLADLWQIPARRRAAQHLLDRTILQLAREAGVGAHDVKAAYYRAKQAERRLEIAAESEQIARHVLDLALARQQAGAGSEVDVNLARSEVHDAELMIQTVRLEVFETRSALTVLLSLRLPPDSLVLTDALPEPREWTMPDDALLSLAAANRLDLKAARVAVEAAMATVEQEHLKVFPTFEVGLAFERAERRPVGGRNPLADSVRASADAGEPTIDLAPREKHGGQDTVLGPSLGMELPIFNQNQGGIARATFMYQQSVQLLDDLGVQVEQEVRLAAARVRTAWGVAGFYRDQVLPLRVTSLDLARTAYEAGRTPLLSVLEAERALLKAREGHVESLHSLVVALVELEKAAGLPTARLLEAPQQIDPEEPHQADPDHR